MNPLALGAAEDGRRDGQWILGLAQVYRTTRRWTNASIAFDRHGDGVLQAYTRRD